MDISGLIIYFSIAFVIFRGTPLWGLALLEIGLKRALVLSWNL
jgi:hypothetical protein